MRYYPARNITRCMFDVWSAAVAAEATMDDATYHMGATYAVNKRAVSCMDTKRDITDAEMTFSPKASTISLQPVPAPRKCKSIRLSTSVW